VLVEPSIDGERIRLRQAERADLPVLLDILAEASVARWWQGSSRTELVELVMAQAGDDGDGGETTVFVAELDDEVVGLLYANEQLHPDYRHASIDISLRTSAQGQGLGTDAVRTLARWLVDHRGHHRLTIDPAADNPAAIACYRKVGFRPVGVLRGYERRDDGGWHDGLLMEVLAEELAHDHGMSPAPRALRGADESDSPFLALPASAHLAANDLAFAILDRYPASPGHALIVPKRLVTTWWDATDAERRALLALADEVRALLDDRYAPDGYNLGVNVGPAAGQTVDHLHLHLIPRYAGDAADPRGGIRHAVPARGNWELVAEERDQRRGAIDAP